MTLLITFLVAVTVSLIWYFSENARQNNIGTLCCIYWGAGLMWLVDSVVEYLEMGAEFFVPDTASMINDGFLGLSAVVLGTIIWLGIIMIKNPKGVSKRITHKN